MSFCSGSKIFSMFIGFL